LNKSLYLLKIFPLLIVFLISSGTTARTLSFSGPKDYARLIEGLSSKELAELKAGFSLFAKPWVAAPSSTRVRDGLGPHFNATSCMSCHARMGRGNPYSEEGSVNHPILFRVSTSNDLFSGPVPDPNYGLQLQINSLAKVQRESQVSARFEYFTGSFSDGEVYELRRAKFHFTKLNYGSLDSKTHFSPRTSPHLAGLGLIDQIDEEDVLALEDPEDLNKDGISGKANFSWSPSQKKLLVGRFGHKANVPTLLDQIAGAFQGDMGITSTLFPSENCSELQADCHGIINGGDPEISDKHLGFVHLLLSSIDAPRVTRLKGFNKGREHFSKIGCTNCHRAEFKVKDRVINPYSDFLLHDMGEDLADNREDFGASGREWKTPPLWGIGSLRKVNGHTNLLHDGRARSVEEAILWHGGEAMKSRERYRSLSKEERRELLSFINSL